MFSEFSLILKIIYVTYITLVVAISLTLPVLYVFALVRKKYVVKAQLLSWKHDKYSCEITCDIGITNLAQPPFLVKGIYIKPAFNSSSFRKIKYVGIIASDNEAAQLPLSFSVLQKKKVTVSFPIDLSNYYDDKKHGKATKQWTLIFSTNRLQRNFKIDAPF